LHSFLIPAPALPFLLAAALDISKWGSQSLCGCSIGRVSQSWAAVWWRGRVWQSFEECPTSPCWRRSIRFPLSLLRFGRGTRQAASIWGLASAENAEFASQCLLWCWTAPSTSPSPAPTSRALAALTQRQKNCYWSLHSFVICCLLWNFPQFL
jgi:hypothetical protein